MKAQLVVEFATKDQEKLDSNLDEKAKKFAKCIHECLGGSFHRYGSQKELAEELYGQIAAGGATPTMVSETSTNFKGIERSFSISLALRTKRLEIQASHEKEALPAAEKLEELLKTLKEELKAEAVTIKGAKGDGAFLLIENLDEWVKDVRQN